MINTASRPRAPASSTTLSIPLGLGDAGVIARCPQPFGPFALGGQRVQGSVFRGRPALAFGAALHAGNMTFVAPDWQPSAPLVSPVPFCVALFSLI